jgi:hypothetical protein
MSEPVKQIPKKQHYIPCAYLAGFSRNQLDNKRKSRILRTDADIENRSVTCETQCYSEYFYSEKEAVRVEKELKILEDEYHRIIEESMCGRLTKKDQKLLITHHAIFLGRSLGVDSVREQDGYDTFNQASLKLLEHFYYDKTINDLKSKEFTKLLFEKYESFMVTTE